MSQSAILVTALRLPTENVNALLRGQTIIAIPGTFLRPGQQFALCSSVESDNSDRALIEAWARCHLCQAPSQAYTPQELSEITFLPIDYLERLLTEKPTFFLAYLKVYWLPQVLEVSLKFNGQFASLTKPLSVNSQFPVLPNIIFEQRKTLQPSAQPELEQLYIGLSRIAIQDPAADELKQEVEALLEGVNNFLPKGSINSSLALDWIQTIVSLGDRSIELDEGKSTYQAGTDFEQIVHKSLQFLGFQVDETHKGGAGGLDLYCSAPFPLIGECKAGKGIPGNTVKELVDLGGKHVGGSNFLDAIKLIIGPGKPTSHLIQSALQWKVSIINPMSLQKLVELKAKYPGAINLLELKKYLEPGQIDSNIDSYIEKVLQRIEVCSNLVQTVKQLMDAEPDRTQFGVVEIRTHYNAIFVPQGKIRLDETPTYEYLIELSSPLTGYLGRIEGGTGLQSDRFYFLRDLVVES